MHLPGDTRRLRFRAFAEADQAICQQLFADTVVMRYFEATRTPEETRDWLAWIAESYRDNGFGLWALYRRSDDAFLGYCGLILQCDVDGHDETEIGYLLNRAYWGQGYASEAAAACRDHAFDRLGVERVISLIDPRNSASIAVALRIGHHFIKSVHRWDKRMDVYGQSRPPSPSDMA